MITTSRHRDILEITISNPPVNALAAQVRTGLAAALAAAQSDNSVRAIVIRGAGKLFSAGADITEFSKPPLDPSLPDVVDAIEASAKPVIAAINGSALGGGLEIALACHYRIAAPEAKLGLPEVKLGVSPGAGGTQRLPRLIGVQDALRIIVSGNPISASEAANLGLVDKIASNDDFATDAIAYARTLERVRRTGDISIDEDAAAFDRFITANARRIQGLDAPNACIAAVKAATVLPLVEGQEKERELFLRLVVGEQSKALRHVFFAERAAGKISGLPANLAHRPIRKIGVLGAGTMGGGISMNFLSADFAVTIVEASQEALDRGVALMRSNYETSASKGRITTEQVQTAMDLLTPTLDFAELADCDLVIEAVYEDMDLKKEIFRRLDACVKPGAILASNTSFLNIDEIAAATQRPRDVLGLHFFSPANVMTLLEVVRGAKTAPDTLATCMELARKIGKTAVVSATCYGFIGNRMLIPRHHQAAMLLLEGATPQQIDRVHTEFGMPMGPFQMSDLAGVDVGWHRDIEKIESINDALCTAGRWGQKARAGYYDYDDKRRATPSPVVDNIINEFRARIDVKPRAISDEEITVRTLYTMVNEGAHILDEGVAQRASDIDVVWIHGYGWPRHKGGPMFWAEQIRLETVVNGLSRYSSVLGTDFKLSRLLTRCAADNTPLNH